MSAGPVSNMSRRCISCGYDIASLVGNRAREAEFVCPECGVSLNESLAAPPGLAVQRTWSTRDYLRFLDGALFHPLRTADAINPHLTDGASLMMMNCFAAGAVAGAISMIIGVVFTVISGHFHFLLGGVAGAIMLPVVLGLLLLLAACALCLVTSLAAALLGVPMSSVRAYAAMDIATVWLLPLPLVALLAQPLPALLQWPTMPSWMVLGAALSPFAMAFVVGVVVHLRWAARRE